MDALSCRISHKLMRLNTASIFRVLPKLQEVTYDRAIFEEYISFLIFDLFGECETVDEIISLADRLQKDIHDKKKHIFDKLIADCLLDDLYCESLVKDIDDQNRLSSRGYNGNTTGLSGILATANALKMILC